MADFHFLRPEWFLALIPLVILLMRSGAMTIHRSGWNKHIPAHLLDTLLIKGGKHHRLHWLLLALAWLLATVAMAGPTWEKLPQPVFQVQKGQVLVLDMSMSMRATDIKPDRLTRARFKALDLLDQIDDGETGLIAYAGDAFVISPLTPDKKNLKLLIPSLAPEIMPEQGSNPGYALTLATELLENAGYSKGDIYLITDGIDAQDSKDIQDVLNANPYRLSVLGAGTEQGAPIKLTSGELLRDGRGSIVIPKVNTGLLESIARQGNGRFSMMRSDDSDLQYLVQQQELLKKQEQEQNNAMVGDQWAEIGPWLLLPVILIAAYAFRPGLLFVFVCLLLPPVPQAHASLWDDLWQTKDQQGQQAYQQQEYARAAESFKDPGWKASALYRDGDFESALEQFTDPQDAVSWYNKGNTLAQLGDFEQAVAAYNEALALNPDFEDAQFNKSLLEQLQQQQQSQQDSQDSQQNSEQSEQQDSDQQQSEQSQSEQQDQQQQDAQQQQSEQQDSQQQSSAQDSQEQGEQESQQSEQQDSEQGDETQEEKEQQAQEQQASESEQQQGDEQQASMAEQEGEEDNSEEAQQMRRLLRKIDDDPSLLLRNKMRLEYQKRRRSQTSQGVQKKW